MRYLLIIPFLLQLVFTDTIHISSSTSYKQISDIVYLGVVKGKIYYRENNSSEIKRIDKNIVTKITNDNGRTIPINKIKYIPERGSKYYVDIQTDLKSFPTASVMFTMAGLIHLYEIEEPIYDLDKIRNLERLKALCVIIGGISLNNNNRQSYSINPINKNSFLNLSFKF
tara:strand:+ start:1105 stop:1614 length:510 start_codon:yes stop_codon:yes gene_type:complete